MHNRYMRLSRFAAVVSIIVVLLAGSVAPVWAENANPGVLPPPARPHGSSYEEWSARWWQWALSVRADQNPFFDEGGSCANGASGQAGPVWFLTGVLNVSGTAERDCKVPAGKALFFPLINTECSTLEAPPFYGSNEEELSACVNQFHFGEVFATIDGVPVKNLENYKVESPMFEFTLPAGDVWGLGPNSGQSVSNGYYLMLAPLSAGEHVVHFGGKYTDFDFSLDITYNLTVAK